MPEGTLVGSTITGHSSWERMATVGTAAFHQPRPGAMEEAVSWA